MAHDSIQNAEKETEHLLSLDEVLSNNSVPLATTKRKSPMSNLRTVHWQQLSLVLVTLVVFCQLFVFLSGIGVESLFQIRRHFNVHLTKSNLNNATLYLVEHPIQPSVSLLLGNGTGQRIVILPGPHKTGTSSVQAALKNWIDQPPAGSQFNKWAYPILTEEDWQLMAESDENMYVNSKGFHPFFHALLSSSCGDTIQYNHNTALVRQYSKKMQQYWKEGFNLVLASETLDLLVDEKAAILNPKYADEYWTRALECFPSSSDSGALQNLPPIVVGIQHRTPRLEHLISLWHEVGGNSTLLEFATDLNAIEPHSFVLNSLGLAEFFAQQGYPVMIIDTGGMAGLTNKVTLPIAAACYFLQMPCHTNELGEFGITLAEETVSNSTCMISSKNENERKDVTDRGISSQTLGLINKLLMDFDCQYQRLAHFDNVKLLYGESTFSHCHHLPLDAKPRQIFKTIRAIAALLCKEYPTSKNCQAF